MSGSYVDAMADLTHAGFGMLFEGVKCVTFTDFPDFPNVGDTAIALGSMRFLELAGIEILGTYGLSTLRRKVLKSEVPIFIKGGGNIAGLYPLSDRHRYRISEQLSPGTRLIQGPQTVHFTSEVARAEFVGRFGARESVKIAARDEPSRELLAGLGMRAEVLLMPDAVHMLGVIDAPRPVRQTMFLMRRDIEANERQAAGTQDWPRDDLLTWLGRWRRWNPALSLVLNPSTERWLEIGHRRFERGVAMLSAGETIVTDRLHAMLIGLQMGRSVIAVDNNNQKLTKYADTWFGATSPDVRFAKSFGDACRILR